MVSALIIIIITRIPLFAETLTLSLEDMENIEAAIVMVVIEEARAPITIHLPVESII